MLEIITYKLYYSFTKEEATSLELEKINIEGVNDVYAVPVLQKEFMRAVNEKWKENPPWQRYQKKLMQDLAVLDMEKERAIDLPQYEKLNGEKNLYSIRHPESKKNVRVIYTIVAGRIIILLVAFLEKGDGDYRKAIRVAKSRLKRLEN